MIPRHMPEVLGNYVVIKSYVDANHSGNMAYRRSNSGVIIYVNNSPIIWHIKIQYTVEASSVGSEFVYIGIATEIIESLRYKLRCFRIPVEGPAEVFCDNMSVVKNSSIPTSALNKRHNDICYHRVREAQASGIIRVGWILIEFNLEYLFTRIIIPGNTGHTLVD